MPCEKHTKEPCSGVGLKWYYFTFGCGQEHSNGYVKILAFCSNAARVIMFKMHGSKWSMQYDSEDEAGVKRFGLHLVAEYRQIDLEKERSMWQDVAECNGGHFDQG